MYEFSSEVYRELAEHLFEEIGGRSFFCGAVVYYDGEVCCRLRTTLIISRKSHGSDAPSIPLLRVVPVWWEMETTIGGESLLNDFSFGEMLNLTMQSDGELW